MRNPVEAKRYICKAEAPIIVEEMFNKPRPELNGMSLKYAVTHVYIALYIGITKRTLKVEGLHFLITSRKYLGKW